MGDKIALKKAASAVVVVVVMCTTDQEDAMVLVAMSSDDTDRFNAMIVPGSATSRRLRAEVTSDAVVGAVKVDVGSDAEVVDDDCEFMNDASTAGLTGESGNVPTRALLSVT